MAYVIKTVYGLFNYALGDLSDPRTDDLPLTSSILYPFVICMSYLYFVNVSGPAIMKNRKPFELDNIMMLYNAFQVVICIFITVEGSKIALYHYDWRCAAIDYSNSEQALYMVKLVWVYYMVKIIDLLDTIFFVLRKKNSQITFLHTYHHFGMVAVSWIGTRYMAGGHTVYVGLINCVVHAIMYFYYLLTAYDKELKKSIWWKKHITQLQIAQFSSFFFIYGQLLFREKCDFPVGTQVLFLPQVGIMTFLFMDFYYKTYMSKPVKSVPPKVEDSEECKPSTSKGIKAA